MSKYFLPDDKINIECSANNIKKNSNLSLEDTPVKGIRDIPWLKVKVLNSEAYQNMIKTVESSNLNTVCQSAKCPNISECWNKRHVAFMILGNICTRSCKFCNVKTGKPEFVDKEEPKKISSLVKRFKAKHVVITSVDRDDLEDGGASQFVNCIKEIRLLSPLTTIEILTPDFINKSQAKNIILSNPPDVFNHNLETVPRLYPKIKPGARYFNSLNLLYEIKKQNSFIFTKSGIIVGMGEEDGEIIQAMDDLRSAQVDFLTIGQYLRPSINHMPVSRFVTPEEFKNLETIAYAKGFSMVSATPLTRSSYHADEDFEKLRQKLKIKNPDYLHSSKEV